MASSNPPAHYHLQPGMMLDRYELLCVLAQGGMANVWLARMQGKLGFQRLFAIKTILPHVADDGAFRAMFLDEARIASRIQHPNVVHIADVGESDGVTYLVMDLVEGEPLQKLPRACEKLGQRIPLGIVLRILADACHGLHAAHELRDETGALLEVVHRDMSPSNIIITTAGVAKVIDFGVAKALDRATVQTSAGTLKGKINFMPREQALGREVDRRADVWSLGAVLYYLLEGRPPLQGDNQLATLQLAMNGAPIAPLPMSLPKTLRMTVEKALAHEPSQRFQTAAEMGDALEGLMRKLGVLTTHSEVGTFVQRVLGEKLAARRHFVATALAEAGNRMEARPTSVALGELEIEASDGSHSLRGGVVAVPTDIIAVPSALVAAAAAAGAHDLVPERTVGTFVAPPTNAQPSVPWLVVGLGGAVLTAMVGALVIVVALRAHARGPTAGAGVLESRTVPAAVTTTVPIVVTPAAPPTPLVVTPVAPTPAKGENDTATPTGAARPPSSPVITAVRPPTTGTPSPSIALPIASSKPAVATAPPIASSKPAVAAAPPKFAPAPPRAAAPAKKRDDEAGF